MNYLGAAIQGVGASNTMAEGRRSKAMLEQQGKVTYEQAVQSADAIGREYRQIAGRQAAAMAENGGAYEGSNLKLLHQSESVAFLDRLYTLYHGEMNKLGLEVEGQTALTNAFLSATRSLAGGMGGMMGGG
jgi:hypothetical protein